MKLRYYSFFSGFSATGTTLKLVNTYFSNKRIAYGVLVRRHRSVPA